MTRTGATLIPDMICMICEVSVPGEELHTLIANPQGAQPVAWVHPECVTETDYYSQ